VYAPGQTSRDRRADEADRERDRAEDAERTVRSVEAPTVAAARLNFQIPQFFLQIALDN